MAAKKKTSEVLMCISCDTRWRDIKSEYCPECKPFDSETPVENVTTKVVTNVSSIIEKSETLVVNIDEKFALLREPFPDSQIESKTEYRGGSTVTLSYVSHASVIQRLLSVDPTWTIYPMYTHKDGGPLLDIDPVTNIPIGAWFEITILGITKPCYGSFSPAVRKETMEAIKKGEQSWAYQSDPDFWKKIESDAISRGAMKFGVALDLWSKVKLIVSDEEIELEELNKSITNIKSKVKTDDDKGKLRAELNKLGVTQLKELTVAQAIAIEALFQ